MSKSKVNLVDEKGNKLESKKFNAEDASVLVSNNLNSTVKVRPRNNLVLVKIVGEVSTLQLLSKKDGFSTVYKEFIAIAQGDAVRDNLVNKNIVLENGIFGPEGMGVHFRLSERFNTANVYTVIDMLTKLPSEEYRKYLNDNPYTKIVDYMLLPEHHIIAVNE